MINKQKIKAGFGGYYARIMGLIKLDYYNFENKLIKYIIIRI